MSKYWYYIERNSFYEPDDLSLISLKEGKYIGNINSTFKVVNILNDYFITNNDRVIAKLSISTKNRSDVIRKTIFKKNVYLSCVSEIYVLKEFRGMGIAQKLYQFILEKGITDALLSDIIWTRAGEELWKRFTQNNYIDTFYFLYPTLEYNRLTIENFEDIFDQNKTLIPWMTLKGKADEILLKRKRNLYKWY